MARPAVILVAPTITTSFFLKLAWALVLNREVNLWSKWGDEEVDAAIAMDWFLMSKIWFLGWRVMKLTDKRSDYVLCGVLLHNKQCKFHADMQTCQFSFNFYVLPSFTLKNTFFIIVLRKITLCQFNPSK